MWLTRLLRVASVVPGRFADQAHEGPPAERCDEQGDGDGDQGNHLFGSSHAPQHMRTAFQELSDSITCGDLDPDVLGTPDRLSGASRKFRARCQAAVGKACAGSSRR
jgi:hypothetical protein